LLHEFVHVGMKIGGNAVNEATTCRFENKIRFEQRWKMRVTRGGVWLAGSPVNKLIENRSKA
jgi:hypothetical protein